MPQSPPRLNSCSNITVAESTPASRSVLTDQQTCEPHQQTLDDIEFQDILSDYEEEVLFKTRCLWIRNKCNLIIGKSV